MNHNPTLHPFQDDETRERADALVARAEEVIS